MMLEGFVGTHFYLIACVFNTDIFGPACCYFCASIYKLICWRQFLKTFFQWPNPTSIEFKWKTPTDLNRKQLRQSGQEFGAVITHWNATSWEQISQSKRKTPPWEITGEYPLINTLGHGTMEFLPWLCQRNRSAAHDSSPPASATTGSFVGLCTTASIHWTWMGGTGQLKQKNCTR